ncbi:hypothetical protein CTheo_1829 [Ceratobasidium theobromae]|uniref:HNH nuclease domain-containing protein n=1 Tax=Ceratobasidium theobromae TaxID=1582974 RepID=A0A5N5QSD7_9AGAM|nr:hypothetical protein CTheo_1829 [Ceratobasidium theobromae]
MTGCNEQVNGEPKTPILSVADDSSNSSYYEVPPSALRTLSVYSTPPSDISRPSQISIRAKDNLRVVSPDKALCVISRDSESVDCCHVLRRSTRNKYIGVLEKAWGVPQGELNIDTTQNLIFLRADFHRTFDSSNWALVPKMTVLEKITVEVVLQSNSTTCEKFTEKFPGISWSYDFVHFRGAPDRFLRRGESIDSFTIHQQPFSDFPSIPPHIHPYFVICNVAQKVNKIRKGSEWDSIVFHSDLKKRVELCSAVYNKWLTISSTLLGQDLLTPTESHTTTSLQSRMSSSPSQLPKPRKRQRRSSGIPQTSISTQTPPGGNDPKCQRTLSSSLSAGSLNTPKVTQATTCGERLRLDQAGLNEQIHIQYSPNISAWVKGLEAPEYPDVSLVSSSVDAQRALEQYRQEGKAHIGLHEPEGT